MARPAPTSTPPRTTPRTRCTNSSSEGVLSASLVPVLTDLSVRGDRDGERAVITVSIVAFAVVTALAVLAAPVVFRLVSLAPDESIDADLFRSAGTVLSRFFLIQIFFYGCTAVSAAVLNARRRFFAAARAPVLANVVTIAGFVLLPDEPAGGVAVGGRP